MPPRPGTAKPILGEASFSAFYVKNPHIAQRCRVSLMPPRPGTAKPILYPPSHLANQPTSQQASYSNDSWSFTMYCRIDSTWRLSLAT